VPGGSIRAGQVRHPDAVAAPEGFVPCAQSANLYFRWESAWGGAKVYGTESLAVTLFNGGYALRAVQLDIAGRDESGQDLFRIRQEVDELLPGEEVQVEVPSYEIPAPAQDLMVTLVSAELGSDD
jgi:hypothetical protein